MDRWTGLASMTKVNSHAGMNEPRILEIFTNPSLDPVKWMSGMIGPTTVYAIDRMTQWSSVIRSSRDHVVSRQSHLS